MTAATTTCPACGVAVVAGYVRCPKCQTTLPASPIAIARTRSGPVVMAGGTAVPSRGGVPVLPLVGLAVAALGVGLYVMVGRSSAAKPERPQPAAGSAVEEPDEETFGEATTQGAAQTSQTPQRDANRIDPNAVARAVARALKNVRLWSTVEAVGARLDVTSGSCRDPNMVPMLDAARQALRNAGLTRVRCMENSGAVVFERNL